MSQLISCPECKKHLQVPDDLLGKQVQCPECRHTFIAAESAPTEMVASTSSAASKPKSAPASTAKKKAEWDKRDEEDDEDDTRARKSKPPSKRRRDDDDDDDDDDYDDVRRRRRRSRYGGGYVPHRGGMILAFGIVAMASFLLGIPLAPIFGPIAWFMGNSDMAEIRAGRMDPSGESMVQTGRILGIISTIISLVGILAILGFCCFIGVIAGVQQPPRRG